jgi:hypothetical protein
MISLYISRFAVVSSSVVSRQCANYDEVLVAAKASYSVGNTVHIPLISEAIDLASLPAEHMSEDSCGRTNATLVPTNTIAIILAANSAMLGQQ